MPLRHPERRQREQRQTKPGEDDSRARMKTQKTTRREDKAKVTTPTCEVGIHRKITRDKAMKTVSYLIDQAMQYNLDGEESLTKDQVEVRNNQLEEALT